MSYAVVRKTLPFWGVVGRFLLPCFLVFATYNPSYYSLTTLIISDVSNPAVRAFLAFSLGLGWLIILRISFAGLGRIGWFFILSFVTILILMEIELQIFRSLSSFSQILLLELLAAGILSFGLVQSYWVRGISGQSAIIKNPP
jgi:hypothetical protein